MTQPDGTMMSYSASSSSDSDDQESSSSTDLEAPLKKKSQKHPGSILALLVNHVKMQLSQGSVLDLDPSTDSVTQGVKVTTYFSLHVRNEFPQAMREMRELYSLARIIDTIRTGDVAVASDQLAARFIALHQSLLDGGWSTARHMELCPLEDSNGAGIKKALQTISEDAGLRRRWSLWPRLRTWRTPVVILGIGGQSRRWRRKRKGKEPQGKRQEQRHKRKRKGKQHPGQPLGSEHGQGGGQTPHKVKDGLVNRTYKSQLGTSFDVSLPVADLQSDMHEEILRAAALGKPDCAAPEDDLPGLSKALWHRVLQSSSTLDLLGVSIAWSLVHWSYDDHADGAFTLIERFLPAVLPERYALPIPLGELEQVVQKLKITPFEQWDQLTLEESFVGDCWLLLCVYGINSLHSVAQLPPAGVWRVQRRRALDSMRMHVQRFRKSGEGCELKVRVDEVEQELKARRVNYSGEELMQCHPLTLKQIIPSLPPAQHGGCVPAVEWVGEITKHFLYHPELNVVEDVGQKLPRLQGKIHIPPSELDAVVSELVSRNVCTWVPLKQVFHYRGEPVLNGLFGVEKPTRLPDGSPVLRVIMNLVPSNSCLKQISGGTSSLPFIGQWLGVALDQDEEVRIWQSDMSAAFYLFAVPPPWRGYLSFNVLKNGAEIGRDPQTTFALCCQVIPMGFNSSVSLMQEISENLLKRSQLPFKCRISRGKSLPPWLSQALQEQKESGLPWYHIYLDNFCAGARIPFPDTGEQGDLFHQLAEEAWRHAGVVSSEKKRKARLAEGSEVGSYLNGPLQMMGISPERTLKLAQATLCLLGRYALNRKITQVVAGRWMHAFQFRRPLMSCFDALWSYVGRSQTKRFGYDQVRRELARALCLLPLCHTHLGAKISNFTTASDASSTGGAVGIGRELSEVGCDFVEASLQSFGEVHEIPVLVISLFNGIGGALRCYDVLGAAPAGIIIVDICKEANRIAARRWPGALLIEDVRSITEETVRDWRLKRTQILEVHLWAGFPCKDLSSARAFRQNLWGEQSSLFYEVPRIKKLLHDEFPSEVVIKYVLENVASMDREAANEISHTIGTTPYFLDCADAVPIHRPRLCWTSEDWHGVMDGVKLQPQQYWIQVTAEAPWPDVSQWITPGWTWEGSDDGTILPTAMRVVAKDSPPPNPAGLERTPWDAQQRWAADQFRLPPYQYKDQFIFWNEATAKWRRPNADEKELLLGYGFQHTSLAMSAGDIKKSKSKYEDCRQSLLGDGFSIFSFIIAAAGLCRRWLKVPSYHHLASRMGVAPGFCPHPQLVIPLQRRLAYGKGSDVMLPPHRLNRLLLTKMNHTGSDIRISTGTICNPKCFPRQGAEPTWWEWVPVFRTAWLNSEHINVLELRSIFLTVKHCVSHLRCFDTRLFHLSDSYVCISVVSKGRSSSIRLQRVLRQMNAYLLAYGILLMLCHVESTHNPTDEASRASSAGHKKNPR